MDVPAVDSDTVLDLAHRFSFHELVVEDILADTEFPKIDEFGDQLFVVLHGLAADTDTIRTVEFDAVVGDDFLVTFHREALPGVEWMIEASQRGVGADGPDILLARIAEAGSRRLLPLVDAVDARIEELEDEAILGDPGIPAQVMQMRREMVVLRRVIAPQREVFLRLRDGATALGQRAEERFSDVYDHQYRIVESLDSARALLGAVLDTYRSTVAEMMNEVMKVLTVFAAILLPLSLMAGIYGMNFENIPELSYRWAYFALLGVMAVTAISLWVYFARRKFIGGPRIDRVPKVVGKGLAGLVHLTMKPIRFVKLNDHTDRKS
ncbi:MAG: magnesium transporter CorA family protein [Acidimicrobiia bacterium]|nr:magnesium transporter CorA family protein [Acidimicrobiia bacterium]